MLWNAADFTPLGMLFYPRGTNTRPIGVCSDGFNFWIAFLETQRSRALLALLVHPSLDRQPLEVDRLARVRPLVLARRARAPVESRIVDAVDVDEPALEAHVVALRDAADACSGASRREDVDVGGVRHDRAAVERDIPVRQKKKRENWE